jgi:hypothetical protein
MKNKSVVAAMLLAAWIAVMACGSVSTPAITKAAEKTDRAQVETAAPVDAATEAPPAAEATEAVPALEPSPTPQPTPTATSGIAKVGDTVVQGGYIITLLNVEKSEKGYQSYGAPGEGKVLVAVEIVIESGADEGVHVNPFYCSLKDSDGYEYGVYFFGKDPALQSTNDLPKGEKSRGWVTFEVVKTATGLVFIYAPITFGADVRIKFDLGM